MFRIERKVLVLLSNVLSTSMKDELGVGKDRYELIGKKYFTFPPGTGVTGDLGHHLALS